MMVTLIAADDDLNLPRTIWIALEKNKHQVLSFMSTEDSE